MPRTHTGLPKATRTELSKRTLLGQLLTIDGEREDENAFSSWKPLSAGK